jgi:hypothetical protein
MMFAALLLASIGLRGETTCPTVDQISARLAGLDSDHSGFVRWVDVEEKRDVLQLTLWSADGSVEAVRELPRQSSCAALADASAATIGVWATRLVAPRTVEPPVPEHIGYRIFEVSVLEAERERVRLLPGPDQEPRRLRGSVIVMATGLALQAGGAMVAGLWMNSTAQHPADAGIVAAGALTLAMGAVLGTSGLLWLWAAITRRTPDEAIAF